MAEIRLQIPGGWMTTQDLRDLVGWAGSAGATWFRAGDFQDWVLEDPRSTVGPPPERFARRLQGSLQSSAFAPASASTPWLTSGVWRSLLATLPDPGDLDVQLLHDAGAHRFLRWGHLRLSALRAPHQWSVLVRRPRTDRVTRLEAACHTGEIPALVDRFRDAWAAGDERAWAGVPASVSASPPQVRSEALETFHEETSSSFSFGYWKPDARLSVSRLRELAWLAWDSGAPRIWITPERVLVFQGMDRAHRPLWEQWMAANRLIGHHNELDLALQTAGWGVQARTARADVLEHLSRADLMPPSRRLVVADDELNRSDGVCALGTPLLVRTPNSWLFRSADGSRSGEGTLEEALGALETPVRAGSADPTQAPVSLEGSAHQCASCLTVYEKRWGDPGARVEPDTEFENLPPGWQCPVCGGPREGYSPVYKNSKIGWSRPEDPSLLTSSLDYIL